MVGFHILCLCSGVIADTSFDLSSTRGLMPFNFDSSASNSITGVSVDFVRLRISLAAWRFFSILVLCSCVKFCEVEDFGTKEGDSDVKLEWFGECSSTSLVSN